MGIFVKICGCCSRRDVDAVAALEPDAVGFVFWPGSPRYVAPATVGEWTTNWPVSIARVGVFVDASRDEIHTAMDAAHLDIAQLHGMESPEFCAALHRRYWKAIHLNRPLPERLEAYSAEAFVVDHHGTTQPGGTGTTVERAVARAFVADAPRNVVLAGGLHVGTVQQAIRAVHPWGVDVSSGVESAPGKKDIGQVKEFIEQCRNAD